MQKHKVILTFFIIEFIYFLKNIELLTNRLYIIILIKFIIKQLFIFNIITCIFAY